MSVKNNMSTLKRKYVMMFMILLPGTVLFSQAKDSTERFSRYKDNYFLVTSMNHWSETKFQFSVKYRLIDLSQFYFGYTQKSFWNAWDFALSSPFKESNYNPEIFYQLRKSDDGWLRDAQVGVEHESNGRDGPESRSWNRGYVQVTIVPMSWFLVRPKMWIPFIVERQNENIKQYRGYGDLSFELSMAKDRDLATLQIEIHKGANLDVHKGGIQVGFVFKPIELIFGEQPKLFNGSFYLQYWNGEGESLLLFDQPVRRLRIGFILSK